MVCGRRVLPLVRSPWKASRVAARCCDYNDKAVEIEARSCESGRVGSFQILFEFSQVLPKHMVDMWSWRECKSLLRSDLCWAVFEVPWILALRGKNWMMCEVATSMRRW